MLVKLSTDKTVSEAAVALQTPVEANHFGVMQVHNLKKSMTKKGAEFARECLIFEVCQPQQAKRVLNENMNVSTALALYAWGVLLTPALGAVLMSASTVIVAINARLLKMK